MERQFAGWEELFEAERLEQCAESLTRKSPLIITKAAATRGTLCRCSDCVGEDHQPKRRIVMGSTADKIKGAANEAIGKAKQGIGEATGSERLQGEGVIQEAKGHGQQALGNAKEVAKDTADKTAGFINKKL
jgi:uncharacterized protein YjbJ (UPF0337 family)